MMKAILIALFMVSALRAYVNPNVQDNIDYIRSEQKLWDAYEVNENPHKDLSWDQLKQKMRGKNFYMEESVYMIDQGQDPPIGYIDEITESDMIPSHFDAREHWPKCKFESKQQGQCGASWAVQVASAIEDRFCIECDGKEVGISAQELLSCTWDAAGCEYGQPIHAWT